MQILLNQNKNKTSTPLNSKLSLNFEQSYNVVNDFDIQETINLYELYKEEKDKCTSYRLIVTINPICSNVLYNPLSILLNNDENNGIRVLDNSFVSSVSQDKYTDCLYQPSKSDYKDYTFFNGVNIFDNYLFRSDLFKQAEKLDYYNNGQHVYGMDDIVSYPSTILNNLTEYNGWVGFKNPSKIVVTDSNDNLTKNAFLRNKDVCDTIHLYPTPDLFSFNQKLRRKSSFIRLENNWNYTLTYPYKSDYNNWLVTDPQSKINGIPILRVDLTNNELFNIPVVKITTVYPHMLKYNDKINIIKINSDNSTSTIKESVIRIDDKDDRIFWIRNSSKYDEISFNNSRIRRDVNGSFSEYYIRIFRKIPNWKFEPEEITIDNIDNKLPLNNVDFTNSIYSMAFSNTIYNDPVTQITYLDNIDLKYLKDNLGRPLTEIFFTVVKNNKGYDSVKTSSSANIQKEFSEDENVEYSHCFGKISSAFELTQIIPDDYVYNYDNYSSIFYIHNLNNDGKLSGFTVDNSTLPNKISYNILSVVGDTSQPGENGKMTFTKSPNKIEDNIIIDNTEFYGDIVEFNPINSEEVVLLDIKHRFNTYQRESSEKIDRILRFHEIYKDDNDKTNAIWQHYNPLSNLNYETTIKDECIDRNKKTPDYFIYRGELNVGPRPEGYYYKPHHKIKLKDWSDKLNQKSFNQIVIEENGYGTEDIVYNDSDGLKMLYFITLQSHKLITDDIVRIEWVNNNTVYDRIYTVKCPLRDKNKFSIIYDEDLLLALNNNLDVVIRYFDRSVPLYSKHIGNGRYVWKNILSDGDKERMDKEYVNHVFTNGNFYLDKEFNLYLKRQDQFNENGLFYSYFPNDLYGDKLNLSNYEVKEIDPLC